MFVIVLSPPVCEQKGGCMVGVSWVKLLLGVGYIIEEVIAREKKRDPKKSTKSVSNSCASELLKIAIFSVCFLVRFL